MAKANWVGRWAGGRIAQGADRRRSFWLEKMVAGRRYSLRLSGVHTEAEAVRELVLFNESPDTYQPPDVREETARLEAAERDRADATSAIVLDAELIGRCIEAMCEGYGSRGPVSRHHAFVTHSCLTDWATSPALFGRDLRRVTLAELRTQLEQWPGSRKHRIVALRSLTAWLRWRGDLGRAEDPTIDLSVPQARRPTPRERSARVYRPEVLEATYAHIPNQTVRDLFRVRLHTGLHETEIERIAHGEGILRPLRGMGRIAATVDVPHKSGQIHRQSVDAPTLAALERLRKLDGRWPTEKTLARNRATAAERSRMPPVYLGNLRHTRITLAAELGSVVYARKKAGAPLDVIARSVGHRSTATTIGHYLGEDVPPMVVVPVPLKHDEDP